MWCGWISFKKLEKENQMYAYYTGSIQANKILRVKNENSEIVKEATIPKTVSYTFFTCPGLTKNYKFYQCDTSGSESAITFNFGTPTSGSDDQDTKTDDGGKYDDDEEEEGSDTDKKTDDKSDEKSDDKSDEKTDDTSDGGDQSDEKTDPQTTDGEPSNDSSTILIVSVSVGIVAVIVIVLVIVFVLTKCRKRDEDSLLTDQGEVTKLQPDE